MQDHSYQGAWSWSSGSGSQQEKNREMVLESRAVLQSQSLSTASSPWMSGRATVLRPADSLSVNRSPLSSSVTLTQTSWPSISPLQPLLWQKPWKDVGWGQFNPSLDQTPFYRDREASSLSDNFQIVFPAFPTGMPPKGLPSQKHSF